MPPRPTKKTRTSIALPEDDDAFIRLPTVLGVWPVSEAEWYRGIAEGRYPKPTKLSKRISAWRVGAIRKLLMAATNDDAA